MHYLMGRYDGERRGARVGVVAATRSSGVLPEPQGSVDGVAAADARAGADARAVRLSPAAGAAAARRLGRRQRALLSRLHRGRTGAAAEAAVAPRDGGASRAATAGDGAQRHLEHGLRRRRARRWPALPRADGARSVHARMPGDRRRARASAARTSSATLERLRFERGLPQRIYCDNGTEFVSAAMDLWAYTNGVILDFSRRGKPTDNAAIESFNGRFREECLNVHWFAVAGGCAAEDRRVSVGLQ